MENSCKIKYINKGLTRNACQHIDHQRYHAATREKDHPTFNKMKQFVSRLRHDQSNRDYSVDLRQLVHVSFKLAAEMGAVTVIRRLDALLPPSAARAEG